MESPEQMIHDYLDPEIETTRTVPESIVLKALVSPETDADALLRCGEFKPTDISDSYPHGSACFRGNSVINGVERKTEVLVGFAGPIRRLINKAFCKHEPTSTLYLTIWHRGL